MAVAIKELGYTNVKIYNGGLKDWKKSGFKINVIEALPDYKGRNIASEELLENIKKASVCDCRQKNKPLLTLIDYRVGRVNNDLKIRSIKTDCETIIGNFDDFLEKEARQKIPRKGLVVLICETGNRDKYMMRFLQKFGYTNVVGLKFGMRGWIKKGFPVQ